MKEPFKHIGLCISAEAWEKLHYIAKYDCRSISSTIRVLINARVAEFEREHGKIETAGKAGPGS